MYAVLQIPEFCLQSVLRLCDKQLQKAAVAAIETETNQGEILAANILARRQGVVNGMTSAKALARCPDLRFLPACADAEANTQTLLLQTAGVLSPYVESTAPGMCTVDLSRSRSDPSLQVRETLRSLHSMHLSARAGIAPLPDLARMAAVRAAPVLAVQRPQAFLKNLPLSELTEDHRLLKITDAWGIRTVQDLLALPKQDAIERLGPAGMTLWTTARGGKARPLRLEPFPDIYEESFDFEGAIETIDPLLFILRRLLDSLCMRLECNQRAAASLTLKIILEDGPPHPLLLQVPAPTSNPDILERILFSHLESLQLAKRAIGLQLCIEPALHSIRQFDLFQTPLKDPNRFGETVAKLRSLTGRGNLGSPSPAESHRPGDFVLREPEAAFPPEAPDSANPADSSRGLPLRRIRPPHDISVHTSAGKPRFMSGPKLSGQIVECRGPYRTSGNWWDQDPWETEEWDIAVECTSANLGKEQANFLARIGRNSSGNWHLEGLYHA